MCHGVRGRWLLGARHRGWLRPQLVVAWLCPEVWGRWLRQGFGNFPKGWLRRGIRGGLLLLRTWEGILPTFQRFNPCRQPCDLIAQLVLLELQAIYDLELHCSSILRSASAAIAMHCSI